MGTNISTTFTGLHFQNPFLLASAPPTESPDNICRAFEAGWGGVVTKTIGLHPVVNVDGPRTKFFRTDSSGQISMNHRPKASSLIASWNWELISDKPLSVWEPRLEEIKRAFPDQILVASIMAGAGSDEELLNWQILAEACTARGVDAFELNLSCPHMDRDDMGSNAGKDRNLITEVVQAVKEATNLPVWVKLTPSTTDITTEAHGAFAGGADAVSSSNTFMALPLIDPETLKPEIHVDGFSSIGGLGGPAILPLSLAKMSQLTQAFPHKAFSGIGGVTTFRDALNYFMLGCGTVQVCTAAMLDKAIGPNVIRTLKDDLAHFLDTHADRGRVIGDFVGLSRECVIPNGQIRRPEAKSYAGGRKVVRQP